MSLSDEIRAHRQHQEWARWEHGGGDRKGPPPVPAYKDCRTCSLRDDYDEPEDRTLFCTTDCPYADLPSGPSAWFLAASLWASMPEAMLVRYADVLGWRKVMDVQLLKESREYEKLAAMMGAKLLG